MKPAAAVATYMKIIRPGLLTAALWTHLWLGMSGSLVLTAAVFIALAALSRLPFDPARRNSWARQAGFGERIWLNRLLVPIPQNINFRIVVLYLVFWTGTMVALLGGVTGALILSLTGLTVAHTAQYVCFKKLIHLYGIMRDKNPLYRFWAASAENDNRASRRRA